MACTVTSKKVLVAGAGGEYISEVKVSSLTSGLPEQVDHAGPTGCIPSQVEFLITTPPTDGSMVEFVWDDTDTTNDHVEFRVTCPAGGSLDGLVGTLIIRFLDQATGGLSTITTT